MFSYIHLYNSKSLDIKADLWIQNVFIRTKLGYLINSKEEENVHWPVMGVRLSNKMFFEKFV